MGADVRIECDGPTGNDCRVWLDGDEITNYCHGIDLAIGVGDAHDLTLHLFVDHLDLAMNADVTVTTPVLRRSGE